jgi:hypothetical protein
MPLETATYINQLVATNPLGSDPIASGDDHLRLIKSALKATFPNITGPVTATQEVINNPFPSGGIIMWSGSIASIPVGWLLCNGTSGTPDLRDRFVVGAGTTYAVGATGGSANAIVVAHTHTFSATSSAVSNDHTHSISLTTGSAGTHQHFVVHNAALSNEGSLAANNYIIRRASYGGDFSYDFSSTPSEANIGLTSNAGAHTHTVSGSTAGQSTGHTHTVSGTTASTGSSATNANLPPYYALAYIMKA